MSFTLLLITDPAVPDLVAITGAVLADAPPGSIAVQARDKGASARKLAELARALLPICRAANAPLLVNDRADVAKVVGAEGVHLPEAGLSVAEARAVLGPAALVGRSCHDRAGLEQAACEGASFATLAPVFEVPGKGAPLGVEGFARAVRGLALDVYALGGIGPADVAALRANGARGVAVIRAVFASADPVGAARALR